MPGPTPARRRLPRRIAPVIGGLVALVLVAGGVASAGPEAVLAGRVVDAAGAPVGGAAVYLLAPDDDALRAETRTDADGRFEVAVADAGPFDVRVGEALQVRDDEGRRRWRTRTAAALGVAPGAAPVILTLALDPAANTVRVRVSSPEGYVSGAEVLAVPTCWLPGASWQSPGGHTNAIGRVDLDDLPAVPVEVRVTRKEPWCPSRGPVVLPDPEGIDLARIELERARVLEGRVLDERGRPVAACGVMVTSSRATPARGWGDLTGEDGVFTIGVPESWEDATLLVGCDAPEETATPRRAVPFACAAEAPLLVHLAGPETAGAGGDESDGSRETRRVVEAVLRAHYVREGQRVLVVERELGGLGNVRDVRTYLEEGVEDSTVADLARRADEAAALPVGLEVGIPMRVIPAAWWRHMVDIRGSMNRGLWRHVYRRFPGSDGLVIVSPVAFSKDGRQAIVHVVNLRARLNADGHWHLLERREDGWHVVRREMTWIS